MAVAFLAMFTLAIGCDNADVADQPTTPVPPGADAHASTAPMGKPALPSNVSGGPAIGEEAPEIVGVDLEGEEFKLSDYRGKVVMLDFYGDW